MFQLNNVGRINMFKKYTTTFLLTTILGIGVMIPASSASVTAQTRYYNSRTGRYVYYKRPNFYRRHRKTINIAAGTGVGMLVGGLVGHRKGVVIGGLAGAGGGALFTHKQRPKNHYTTHYVRRVYSNY